MATNRLLYNILSKDLPATARFYTLLFELQEQFAANWYIQLVQKEKGLELGILQYNHALVPPAFQNATASGGYLTFVVNNVDQVHQQALDLGFEVVQAPQDTDYGQRRMLLKDPNGLLVDASQVIENFNPQQG